jgi:hypothetical protein
MSDKPACKGFGGPIRKQLDWAPPLPFNEQRPIGAALAQGKVIDAKNGRNPKGQSGSGFCKAKQGIRADLRADVRQQSRAWLPWALDGEYLQEGCHTNRSAGRVSNELWQAFGKSPPFAGGIKTSEAPHS